MGSGCSRLSKSILPYDPTPSETNAIVKMSKTLMHQPDAVHAEYYVSQRDVKSEVAFEQIGVTR